MLFPSLVTCPHCFSKFSTQESVFRCSSDRCTARRSGEAIIDGKPLKFSEGDTLGPQVDPVLRSEWEDEGFYSHAFSLKAGFLSGPPTSGHCPVSNARSSQRLCPLCHKAVYPLIGQGSDFRMTLIGGSNAGKSNYIAVLIDELKGAKGGKFGFSVRALDMETGPHYEKTYFTPLFKNKQIVNSTPRTLRKSSTIPPLVFGVEFGAGAANAKRRVTLSLFDPPGEGIINESDVEKFHHFAFNSSGLVLLIDADKLLASGRNGGQLGDANRALEIVMRQLEAQHAGRPKIMPHVAIAVSKADLLRGSNELTPRFWQEPVHAGGYDETDFKVISAEVERLLRLHGGSGLCNVAETMFGRDHVGYFAVSAFGSAPKGTSIGSIEPVRVAEPFLWLLARHGVIPSRSST